MKMHLRRLCLMLCAISLVAVAPLQAQDGALAGTVRSALGDSPLANVVVTVLAGPAQDVGQTATGPTGAFRIEGIPAGTYTVQFNSPGWGTVEESVTITGGQVTSLTVTMEERSFSLNPITVTASKTEEKALDAPAAVDVVSSEDIDEQPATTIADHVKGKTGVDVITTGVQSNYTVVRGFNNIFSGATLTLTDNRIARVPSLRANISHFNPITNLDLDRVEIVLGPGSALYGPNAANGVIHSITKSPIDHPGASFSVAGGLRQQGAGTGFEANDEGLFHGEGRVALAPSESFGIKLSGQYFSGTEFLFIDSAEAEQQAAAEACIAANFDPTTEEGCLAFTEGLILTDPDDLAIFQQAVRNVAGGRDNDLQRWSLDARADFRPTPDTDIIFSAGRMNSLNSVDLTGLGAGQVIDWVNTYLQARFSHKTFFAQAFWNKSDNDDSFLLRSGRSLIDKSSLFVGQLQNATRLGQSSRFIYGVDILLTRPDTEGTINGQNEDDDEISEVGGYLQWEWALSPKFDFVGAARIDNHSELDDPVFSPRAAIVFKPDEENTFRATFNRAFSTPTTLNLYLDISGGQVPLFGPFRYDVRATGSTNDGHMFMRDANGIPMHMSPFAPLLGQTPRTFLPTTTAQLWAEALAIVGLQDPAIAALLGSVVPAPTEADVGVVAAILNPTTEQFTPLAGGVASIMDIPRLEPTITNTFELGYKGLIGDRVLFGVNGYYSRINDFISALEVSTPNVFLNGQDLGAYLTQQFVGLVGVDFGPGVGVVFPDAATAQAQAAGLAQLIGQVPLGVVTTTSAGGSESTLALVYRNLGSVDVFGGEVSADVLLGDSWELGGSISLVDKNEFLSDGANPQLVPLNAPTFKGAAALRYRDEDAGLNGLLRLRGQNGFPANSGVYVGDVDGFTVVDVGLGYQLPGFEGAWLQLDVQNVFDNQYQSFVGTPMLGRFGMLRLRYDFSPF